MIAMKGMKIERAPCILIVGLMSEHLELLRSVPLKFLLFSSSPITRFSYLCQAATQQGLGLDMADHSMVC